MDLSLLSRLIPNPESYVMVSASLRVNFHNTDEKNPSEFKKAPANFLKKFNVFCSILFSWQFCTYLCVLFQSKLRPYC